MPPASCIFWLWPERAVDVQQYHVRVTALTPSAEERLPALTVVGVGRARGGQSFESVSYACCARLYADQPSQKVLQASAGRGPFLSDRVTG